MTDIDKLTVWAGDLINVEEPDATLQDEGYVGGDQPFAENHNWIWWKRDKASNRLIDQANYGKTQAAGVTVFDQVSGLYPPSQDWLHPYSTKNKLPLASAPVALCPGWDYTLEKHVVYAARLGYQGVTQIYNSDNGILTFVNRPLTLDDPAEVVDAICSNGESLFVMTTGKPGFQATFYRFSTNPWSPTPIWSVDSNLLFNQLNRGKNAVIIADAQWIASPCTNATPNTDNSILLINQDGLSTKSGKGNAPSNSLYKPVPFIASNGTNIFFALAGAGLNPDTCQCNIADPTLATNPGGAVTDNPVIGNIGVGLGSIIYDGQLVHHLLANGKVYSYDWDTDKESMLTHAQWQIQNTPTPQAGTVFPSAAFDGMFLWCLQEFDGDSDNNNGFLIPINVGEEAMDESSAKFVNDPRIMIAAPFPDNPTMANTKTVYADNCLFFAPFISDGPSPDVYVYRVPNLQGRKR